ncbi:DNA-binding transcriptional regulator TyrR [compost metagenome]
MHSCFVYRQGRNYSGGVGDSWCKKPKSRGEDVVYIDAPALGASVLAELKETLLTLPGLTRKLAKETEVVLLVNNWPGNVRQLQNLIFRAVATVDDMCVLNFITD